MVLFFHCLGARRVCLSHELFVKCTNNELPINHKMNMTNTSYKVTYADSLEDLELDYKN